MSAETGSLNGRIAIVTGGGSGFGRASAEALAAEGAFVVATGTKNESVSTIDQYLGDRGFGALLDLSHDAEKIAEQADEAMQEVTRRISSTDLAGENTGLTPFEIAVLNAGTRGDADGLAVNLVKHRFEPASYVIAVNLLGNMALGNHLLRSARKVEDLRLIAISSIAKDGHPLQSAYSASKAGLVGYMQSLPGEQGVKNSFGSTATFNTIVPGLVRTPLTEDLGDDFFEKARQATPTQELPVPEDVARMVVFLAQRDSRAINGQVITLDGGLTSGIRV